MRTLDETESCRQQSNHHPLLVSKREAAALLGICLRSVDNLIAAKQLPSRRIGRRVLIPYNALAAFARRDHRFAADGPDGSGRD